MRTLLLILTFCVSTVAYAQTPVHVVGTLYSRHKTTPAYDVAALRRLIVELKPEVLVLDVTPTELAEQKVHPSKVEYPGAVFPLIREGRYRVYAAEPAEPMFSEIVGATSRAHKALTEQRPDDRAALDALDTATYAALKRHWRSPAEVNDALTGRLLAAKKMLEAAFIGPVDARGWSRWNEHTASVVRRAAAENPGKRILVLTGIENRPFVLEALAGDRQLQLVDTERRLDGPSARTRP